MSEFKNITSQEELDAIVKARVAREREKYNDYEELKTKVAEFETKEATYQSTIEGLKTEKNELSSQLESVNGELNQTRLQTAKQRIATEYGLPLDLAERLQGDDEEGFKADAERLASYIKPSQPTPPLKSNEPAISDSKEASWAEMARNLINTGD
ncbi:capsid and scaffold protein [Streptococcus phage Javan425]|uniref:Phage scaffold protein n=1 Tax=Streptococcus porcinus str. Jelinkova 176 TaxID=873448 RepID=A0ABN0CYB2_STRPO|nr:DUF4355 domain-containing protein [Streptococcus porcinus]EGJ28190.1 hypothetical protein STRPO_0284 [Streptococcus porcinus str. Jelinkova 176]QBX18384.1 capsid and scaffold protein [Streptococcus phage Javan423]QBX18427.1 capsid and scaffold protein [Streptococcus phage Javan425]SQG43986.1 phage protein [Streptococcus porcinus]